MSTGSLAKFLQISSFSEATSNSLLLARFSRKELEGKSLPLVVCYD